MPSSPTAAVAARALQRAGARHGRVARPLLARRSLSFALGRAGADTAWGERPGRLETGVIAPLAQAAVVAHDTSTILLSTACSDRLDEAVTYGLPLSVEFRAKAAAAGQIPQHVLRRELAPREADIVTARLIDRAIRPVFGPGFSRPTQVICTTLAFDGIGDVPALAINSTSAALCLAKTIPFLGPIGAVRVGCRKSGNGSHEFLYYPSNSNVLTLEENDLVFDVLVAGTEKGLTMVDLSALAPVAPELVCEALRVAQAQIGKAIQAQHEFLSAAENLSGGGGEPRDDESPDSHAQLDSMEATHVYGKDGIQSNLVDQLLAAGSTSESAEEFDQSSLDESSRPDDDEDWQGVRESAHKVSSDRLKRSGRLVDKIRPIGCIKNFIGPPVHGSGVFSRGGTSVLSTVTLGRLDADSLTLLPYCGEPRKKRFLLHYDSPPYATNETGRVGLNRRMIGHGDLAERAIFAALPSPEELPYMIRATCETTSSDGSSSMASVCATTVAMISAGVPLRELVSGISIGVVMDGAGKDSGVLLTDIDAQEDATGHMDFKIAGTRSGVTAIQMDCKWASGIPVSLLCGAVDRGCTANEEIISHMESSLGLSADNFPPSELAEHIPRVHSITLKPGQSARLIGVAGQTIRDLEEELRCELDIDDVHGTLRVYAKSAGEMAEKVAILNEMLWEPEIGEVLDDCEVIQIMPNGALIKLPGRTIAEGSLHVSEADIRRVSRIDEVVKVGDRLTLKVISNDLGRIKLSLRAMMTPFGRVAPSSSTKSSAPKINKEPVATQQRRLRKEARRLKIEEATVRNQQRKRGEEEKSD
mmetsp:Transcript_18957/g.60605  ORF Transcript_18957/g.60605 Transcript_18957/m.60605 type:complete len:816 (-) Transcript_18957:193-2640(-)